MGFIPLVFWDGVCYTMGEVFCMYQFSYILTDEDYIAFNDHYMTITKAGRQGLWMMRLLMPLISLLVLALLSILEEDRSFVLSLAVVLAALSVVWMCIAKRMLLSTVRQQLKKPNGPLQKAFSRSGVLTVDFSAGFVLDQTPAAEVKIPLSEITLVAVDNTAYYLYYAPNQAFLLPYRCFGSQGEIQQLYNTFRAVLGPEKVG